MPAVSLVVMAAFALVMFVLPLCIAGWIVYDARRQGVLGRSVIWVVVAVFTTLVGALVALAIYVTQVRPKPE